MNSTKMLRRMASGLGAFAIATTAALTLAAPAHAETNPRCADSTQIGATGYLKLDGGRTVASVKQFKGCGKNYAYTYLWQEFRGKGLRPCAMVGVGSDTATARTEGNYCAPANAAEAWSYGTNTLSQCTFAIGWVWGEEIEGHTEVRC
ncbi:MAG: hypothetical protein ABIO03_04125 [Umezawaea sp.]